MSVFPGPGIPFPPKVTAPERPREVVIAAYLLAGASAFWLAAMLATLFAMPQYERHYADLAQSPDGGVPAVMLLSATVFIGLLAVALFVLLGVLDATGRPAARVLTWVFGGLAVGAAALTLGSGAFAGIAWHRWLMNGTAIVTLAFVLAAIVLLALPRSGEYFRRSRETRQALARLAYYARYQPAPWPGPGHMPG